MNAGGTDFDTSKKPEDLVTGNLLQAFNAADDDDKAAAVAAEAKTVGETKEATINTLGDTYTSTKVAKEAAETKLATFEKAQSNLSEKTDACDAAAEATKDAKDSKDAVVAEQDALIAKADKAVKDAEFDREQLVKERYGTVDGTANGAANTETTANDKLADDKTIASNTVLSAETDIKAASTALETAEKEEAKAEKNLTDADDVVATAEANVNQAKEDLATANAQQSTAEGIVVQTTSTP